jgi:23S rRNA pseudouridine1911/1915/1917 synthase
MAKGENRVIFEGEPRAIDAVVRELFGMSWGRARDLVRRGKVLVDGQSMLEPTKRVRAGASIAIDLAARDPRRLREELPLDAIVFADPHVVVVDKPPGIVTIAFDPEGMGASLARRREPGEEVALDKRVRAALARREQPTRPGAPPDLGIVHRLDKETSGLLVFTRSWVAKKTLTQAFRDHTVHRKYLAIVHGIPSPGTIVSHLIENRGDGLRGSVERRHGRARPIGSEKTQRSITHVEVVERFESTSFGSPCALVSCQLETGRTHQIRIHLAEAGHPLVGERVYTRGFPGPLIPAPRIMLHAAELGFAHPGYGGRMMNWTSKPPEDMLELLAALRQPQ